MRPEPAPETPVVRPGSRYAFPGPTLPAGSPRIPNFLTKFVKGWELVPYTARLCIMNLYLHGIDADPCPIRSGIDSLAGDPGERFSLVLTNPPFGKKGTSLSSTSLAIWRKKTLPTSGKISG